MSRRGTLAGVAVVTAVALGACATRTPAPPVVTKPCHAEFVFPYVPVDWQGSRLVAEHEAAWQWLQACDTGRSERAFAALLKKHPAFFPAEVGLGFAGLATAEYETAVRWFDRALAQALTYTPAMVGRGEALMAMGRDGEALGAFEAALAADGSIDLAKRRVELLRFRVLQANLLGAREAAEAGRHVQAVEAYRQAIAASPQSAFLYRELAAVERKRGNPDAAIEQLQRAADLDPSDAAAWRELGEIFEARADHAAAVEAYTQAHTREGSPELQGRIAKLQALLADTRLPPEYRRIGGTSALTRGELAALLAVRFDPLVRSVRRRTSALVTDTRGHWASASIFTVVRTGLMDAYPNHTFQPRGTVRRGDLADAAGRVLNLLGERRPDRLRAWQAARRPIRDVEPGNLHYAAVSLVVASGVMPLLDGDSFEPSRTVSGADALAVMDRLEKLR